MSGNLKAKVKYHLGSLGYLLILMGVIGGPLLGLWLIFKGDIIETLHQLKMSLPGWAWVVMKYGLSFVFGVSFMLVLIILGMLVLAWGSPKHSPSRKNTN